MANLLVIDDDPDCADVLAEVLRREGHDVRLGYNGEEGLRLAMESLPDLAILDVEMPLLDGPSTAYQMFVRDRGLERVPIVLLSGAQHLDRLAAQVGTSYFLAKPYRYEPVMALVRRALAERHAPLPPEQRPKDQIASAPAGRPS